MGRPLHDLTFEGRPAYVFDDPVLAKEEVAPPRPAEAIGRLYDKRVYRVCALKSLLSAAGESAGRGVRITVEDSTFFSKVNYSPAGHCGQVA
jgi:hypothetical protein